MPFVKTSGKCISMKGSNIDEEIEKSYKAINILGGEILSKNEFIIPNTDIKRSIVEVEKIKNTSSIYPRKAGTPTKKPL